MKNNSIFQKDKKNFYKKMQQWIHSWKSGQAYGKMRVKLPTKNMEKIKKRYERENHKSGRMKDHWKRTRKDHYEEKKLASTWNRWDITFLVENTEIIMGKTSNSNAYMDREFKQSTNMANARKDGVYTQVQRFFMWKGFKTYYKSQQLIQDFHLNISTTCKEARCPKWFMEYKPDGNRWKSTKHSRSTMDR